MADNEAKIERDDDSRYKRLRERLREADRSCAKTFKRMGEDFAFMAGHQWSSDDIDYLNAQERPAITFNRVAPIVYSVVGHQINNRMEITYLGRAAGDDRAGELYTGAIRWADDLCDAEDEETEAFTDMCVCGMGWTQTRMVWDENPDGELETVGRCDPLEFRWDPKAAKRNIKDAKWVIRLRWMRREDAEAMWPEIREIDVLSDPERMETAIIHRSDPIPYEGEDVQKFYRLGADEILIAEHQFWEHEVIYRVGDPQTNRLVELSERKFDRMRERLEMMGVPYVRQKKKVYKREVWVGPHLLEEGPNSCPHAFTYQAMTAFRDRDDETGVTTWYGLIATMRDPQQWANKFLSNIQDVLSSNRMGGAFVEEGALQDARQAERDWAAANPLIVLRDGAVTNGKVMERNPLPYPAGLDRLLEWSVQSLPSVTGVNMELLGMVERNQPGVLEAQRKRSAMAILAPLFNALRHHKRARGRIVLYYIREFLADGRLIRITGRDDLKQYVPLVRHEEATTYDIIVSESPQSANQKEETFAVMVELLPTFLNAGIPVPPTLIDYAPLPANLREDWKQFVQQNSQPSPEQQVMARVALEKEQASTLETQTDAELNRVQAAVEQMEAHIKRFEAQTERLKVLADIMDKGR